MGSALLCTYSRIQVIAPSGGLWSGPVARVARPDRVLMPEMAPGLVAVVACKTDHSFPYPRAELVSRSPIPDPKVRTMGDYDTHARPRQYYWCAGGFLINLIITLGVLYTPK